MPKQYNKTDKLELINRIGFKEHFKANTWEDYNQKFFDGLAPKYDVLNEVLSLGQHQRIKKKFIKRLEIQPKSKILDLCTGSGDIALFIAKQYPDCEVIGTDVSEKMLDIAQKRSQGFPNVEFRNADTLHLPFEDNSFDTVLIGFGIRNLVDLNEGIAEMKRVTKEGGKISSLDLGKPKGVLLNFIHKIHFQTIVPFLGKHIFHRGEFNSFRYLPESGKHFPPQDALVQILKSHGLSSVVNYNYMLGSIAQQIAIK